MLYWVHGGEDGSNYHQGRTNTPVNDTNSNESLVEYVSLDAETFENVTLWPPSYTVHPGWWHQEKKKKRIPSQCCSEISIIHQTLHQTRLYLIISCILISPNANLFLPFIRQSSPLLIFIGINARPPTPSRALRPINYHLAIAAARALVRGGGGGPS